MVGITDPEGKSPLFTGGGRGCFLGRVADSRAAPNSLVGRQPAMGRASLSSFASLGLGALEVLPGEA